MEEQLNKPPDPSGFGEATMHATEDVQALLELTSVGCGQARQPATGCSCNAVSIYARQGGWTAGSATAEGSAELGQSVP